MTPSEFVAALGPYADTAAAAIGINRWAILTQWADESGWWTSYASTQLNNPAGQEVYNSPTDWHYIAYPSISAGVQGYIEFMHNGNYGGIIATGPNDVEGTLWAMGQSPWAGGHYGSPPGIDLINIWRSTLEPLAGQQASSPGPGVDPTSLWRATYETAVRLSHAIGLGWPSPPWAGAQGLAVDHLGTVPSLADGANYLASALYGLAIYARTSWAHGNPAATVTPPPTAPAGATDPAQVIAPAYVGAVEVAHALGTEVSAPSWASGQGLSQDHLGHPPDLSSGTAYLAGQLQALLAYVDSFAGVTPPPAVQPPPSGGGGGGGATGGGGGAPPPSYVPPAGAGIPPPLPPVAPAGPGIAGMFTAWGQLQTLLGVTLPGLADETAAAARRLSL
ncbi:MAG TPA: glucosaminidase domain-containing protein [Gaiellales bacterium]|nr:glucosaminidase domain-containing protein [Gaiellales bacterium]